MVSLCDHHCKSISGLSEHILIPCFSEFWWLPPGHGWRLCSEESGCLCGDSGVSLLAPFPVYPYVFICSIWLGWDLDSAIASFSLLCPSLPFGLDVYEDPFDSTFILFCSWPHQAISLTQLPCPIPVPEIFSPATGPAPYLPENRLLRRAWKFFRKETILSSICPQCL